MSSSLSTVHTFTSSPSFFCLFHPFGVLAQHAHRVVDAGQAEPLDAARGEVSVQVEDTPVGQQFLERQAGIDREGDDVGAVEQVVLAQRLYDLLGREVFALEVGERFHFQHQPGVGFAGHQAQIGVQRRDVLAVGEYDRGDLLQRAFLHVDLGTFVYTVVVYDQLVVGSQPYVHFRTEGPDRIGFGERSQGVLRRIGRRPVAAVRDNLGLSENRGSSCEEQGGGEDELFCHIV